VRVRRYLIPLILGTFVAGLWLSAFAAEKSITINPGKQLQLGGIKHAIAAFEKETGIKVNIPKVGGCGFSAKNVGSGNIHLGAMCCPANRDETGRSGLVDTAVARDAIVFVVNKNVPISNLSTQQLRDIYQGRIRNWKDVGGPDAEIRPFAHIMCSNREEVMRQYLVGERNYKKGVVGIDNSRFASWVTNIKDETDVCNTVASTPNSIAPVSRSMVGDNVKVISVDGVMPTNKTIADETYPVVRYLHIVTLGYPEGATKEFIDFLRSKRGQQLLAKEGKIVPLP
jgi:phosphate transport system substrate-binding protein